MPRFIRFSILATAVASLAYFVIGALLPATFTWSGDGIVSAQSGSAGPQKYTAAIIGTRTSTFFGLRERFSYDIQELTLPTGYVRFSSCIVPGPTVSNCTASNGTTYRLQVIKKPAYNQFSDDDGVDVGS
jgi:hypothetical protein